MRAPQLSRGPLAGALHGHANLRSLCALIAANAGACSIYDPALLEPGIGGGEAGFEAGGSAGSEAGGAAGTQAGGVGSEAGGAGSDATAGGATGGDGGGSASSGTGGSASAGGAGSGGVGAEAGTDAGGGSSGGCNPSQPPERVFGAPDGGSIALLGAISDLDFGDDPAIGNGTRYRTLGYDLDQHCSHSGAGSCPSPGWPALFEADGTFGRDNTAGELFERLSDTVPAIGSDAYTARIRQGKGTMFLRVEGYNGGQDDAIVSVSLARTLAHSQPAWSGIDLWTLSAEDHLGDLSQPKYRDSLAYVSGRVLVARFSSVAIRLPNPDDVPLDIPLSRVVLSCRLDPNDVVQPFQARGCVLSGAWHYRDALAALKSFSAPAGVSGSPLCRDAAAYSSFRALLCERVDLTAVAGSASACNALSFAMQFETIGAFQNTQALGALPQAPPRCTAPGTDPALDSCD